LNALTWLAATLGTVASILYDKLPWFIALLIALLLYELAKKGARGFARKVGEAAQTKYTVFLILLLTAVLLFMAWQRGYI